MIKMISEINNATTHSGFSIIQSIFEGLDNASDAKAKNINIEFFESNMDINTENGIKSVNRFEYIIIDDGMGVDNLEDVFEIGREKSDRFNSKEEYRTTNGMYHYGIVSYFNVGTEVTIYTKTNKQWRSITAAYDKVKAKASISDEKILNGEEIEKLRLLTRNKLTNPTGFIVHVKYIPKKYGSKIGGVNLKDYIVEKLKKQLAITYRNIIKNGCNIKVNDKLVQAEDVFLYDDGIPESIRSTKFAHYEITLKKLLERLNDAQFEKELIEKYKDIFKKEELLNEKIYIDFYALNLALKEAQTKKKYEDQYLMPSAKYSGFLLQRNQKIIGDFIKLDNICTDHDDFNNFRGLIYFNPVFDNFFDIQNNKNRCVVTEIIIKEIRDQICNDTRYYAPGSSSTARSRISNALQGKISHENRLKGEFSYETKKNIHQTLKNLNDLRKKLSSDLINEQNLQIVKEYIKEVKDIEKKGPEFISENDVKNKLDQIKKHIKKMNKYIKKIDEDYIKEVENLKQRVNKLSYKSKVIPNLWNVLEPKNEAEMFGILVLLLEEYPDKFDFTIKDFSYQEGVDCLVSIQDDLFKKLNMFDRINGKIEDIKECTGILSKDIDMLDINDGNYCFLEMKMNLPKKMNHSMRLTSHILCWERLNENLIEMSTNNVVYDIDNDRDMVTFNDNDRVKIVYLKEILKEIQEEQEEQENFNK